MTENLILLIVAFFTVMAMKVITGYDPVQLLLDLFRSLVGWLNGRSVKEREKNETKFGQMTEREKRKSLRYRYHSFINEILLDMGWSSRNISVEGIDTLMITISIFVGLLVWILLGSLILGILIAPVFYATAIAFLFLASRMNHTHRKTALMDAEDIICANMGQGVLTAIESNIDSFDPFVTAPFKQFLDEIYNRNASVEAALHNLNVNCGEQFDLFCDKAITYEKEHRPGMENVFQYNINRNAEIRMLDRECAKAFTAMNRNYLLSILIIFGFFCYTTISYSGVGAFYATGFGKFLLTMYLVLSALVFIYIQFIQSKPFRYGGREVLTDATAAVDFENSTFRRTKQTQWISEKAEPLTKRIELLRKKKPDELTDEELQELETYVAALREQEGGNNQ